MFCQSIGWLHTFINNTAVQFCTRSTDRNYQNDAVAAAMRWRQSQIRQQNHKTAVHTRALFGKLSADRQHRTSRRTPSVGLLVLRKCVCVCVCRACVLINAPARRNSPIHMYANNRRTYLDDAPPSETRLCTTTALCVRVCVCVTLCRHTYTHSHTHTITHDWYARHMRRFSVTVLSRCLVRSYRLAQPKLVF